MNKKNLLYGDACSSRICAANEDAPWRSPYRRDYARLIHSPAFRRLQGKTQLFPGHESDFFRNRLTHSLEVAQIAKGIAERLNHVDSFLGENPIDCELPRPHRFPLGKPVSAPSGGSGGAVRPFSGVRTVPEITRPAAAGRRAPGRRSASTAR